MIFRFVDALLCIVLLALELFAFPQNILNIYIICVLCYLLIEFLLSFFNTKKTKSIAKELNNLENQVLLTSDQYSLFAEIADFLELKLAPSFIAFVTESNSVYSVLYYKEKAPSNNLFLELLEHRKASKNQNEVMYHPKKAISIPFYKKNKIEGYVFLGTKTSIARYTKKDLRYIKPVARIIGRVLLLFEAGKYQKEKNQLQSAFSKYISPEIVNSIVANPELLQIGGEKQELSVIFTDLQGFTKISDSMDPVNLVRVLNIYLNEMSEVIIALGGTIDKFEGDAIMAFFGAPTPLRDHAARCCRAALRMKKMERIINNQLISENLITEPLITRIGINTGDMVVGNVGSLKRVDYTIIGTNVNIAARLESANKDYNTTILVSEQTYELVKDSFDFKYIGEAHLRGISRPITVYELIDEKVPDLEEHFETKGIDEPEEFEDVEEVEEL